MVVLAAGFVLVREWYVDDGTPRGLPPDAAVAFARAVLAPLRGATVAVLIVGVVVAAVALAAGPSGPARAVRRAVGRRRPGGSAPPG
jgi:hypothetical protein